MNNAWIISVGTELTLGQSLDTNSAWLAKQLAGIGIRAHRHVTVADELASLRDLLLAGAASCDVILVTGGLGPTEDDLTRQALADAAGQPLEVDEPSLGALQAFFAARQRPMPERNTVQALIPRTARAIHNTCGTAPGIAIAVAGTPVYAMPGVPFEMRAMSIRDVLPVLRARTAGQIIALRHLHTFGLGESLLGERIRDLMQRGRNPEVGTTAELGIVGIRINATAADERAATAMLDEVEAEIRRRLGHVVFGRDEQTLAGVIGELLVARGQTVSTAESCTGGMLGAALTDVPGSSRYYVGGVVGYANETKTRLLGVSAANLSEHGAVSAAVALAMANGAADALHSDYAVSVTGVAGPDGGTMDKPVGLVFIGLRTPEGTRVREYRLGADNPRDVIRTRATRIALNLLRLGLLGLADTGDFWQVRAPGACQ